MHPATRQFVVDSLSRMTGPLVLDADGLNALAGLEGWWEALSGAAVLTPHPGEMARLTGRTTAEVEADRVNTALRAAAKWGQVVLLKGAYTLVAAPDGRLSVNPWAVPALATAGSGDVLAGVIVGLCGAGVERLRRRACRCLPARCLR